MSASSFDRQGLTSNGFIGFVTVAALQASHCDEVAREPGVYAVLRDDVHAVRFLTTNSGGHFKGRDPTVLVPLLEDRWIASTPVLYLGKATSLRQRLRQLVRFGGGFPVGHWGGRYLWQVADAEHLLIAWRPCDEPRSQEQALLSAFAAEFGRLPFANIQR